VVEGFLTAAFKAAGQEIRTPFPRMSYDEAMRRYGSDKPDMRLPAMVDVRDCFATENLETLKLSLDFPILCIRIPGVGELSRKERDELFKLHPQGASAPGATPVNFRDIDFKRLEKSFPDAAAKVRHSCEAQPGDLLVVVGSSTSSPFSTHQQRKAACTQAGDFRLALARKFTNRHKAFARGDFRFLWVTDFPMFEWDERENRWNAAHHPFTSLHDKDIAKLETSFDSIHDPKSPLGEIRALAYDVVLNGTELGSGSIRIHRQDIQRKIFRALGMTEEEAKSRFGFFLEALEYGTPPHGGIALGLDRIVMILAGAESLREVIPFPKTARAVDLMVDAPTPVSEAQLKELGIQVRK
jgi:aspartyl-tRNA synthetase